MKNLKKLETSEVKNVQKSSPKKPEKKVLQTFHFSKTGQVIRAGSYEEALKIVTQN